MAVFNLAVVRPVAGKSGELVCTRTTHAESISEAVKAVRNEFSSAGYVVMQEAAFTGDTGMNTITAALLKAYKNLQHGSMAV